MQPGRSGEVPLIQELIETVEKGLGGRDVTVEGVRIGVFYTAVKLDSGQAGVAFTPIREIPEAVCCPRSASRMPAAGQLAGQRAGELARYALTESPPKVAVGIATLNALSALLMEENRLPGYQRLLGADALDAVEIHPDDRVVLVEAFVPFIRRLEGTVKQLRVVEKNPQALKGDEMEFYRLAEQAAEVLNQG